MIGSTSSVSELKLGRVAMAGGYKDNYGKIPESIQTALSQFSTIRSLNIDSVDSAIMPTILAHLENNDFITEAKLQTFYSHHRDEEYRNVPYHQIEILQKNVEYNKIKSVAQAVIDQKILFPVVVKRMFAPTIDEKGQPIKQVGADIANSLVRDVFPHNIAPYLNKKQNANDNSTPKKLPGLNVMIQHLKNLIPDGLQEKFIFELKGNTGSSNPLRTKQKNI